MNRIFLGDNDQREEILIDRFDRKLSGRGFVMILAKSTNDIPCLLSIFF